MLTGNIDISDRLINDQSGYIYDFVVNQGIVTKLYVKHDYEKRRLKSYPKQTLCKGT